MSTALQSLQEKIKAELAAVRKSVAPPSSNKISTRDKKFSLPDGTVNAGPMHAVILDHRNINKYYTKPYDAKNPSPPDCFAIAKEFAGLSPKNHNDVTDAQADDCEDCAMNAFGSASTGKGKACRNMVRLAIAPITADGADDSVIMTLEVPPSALKHWNKHVNDLESSGLLPVQVVTEIAFDQSKAYPCPTFKVSRAHEELETFWKLREQAQATLDQAPAGG